MKLNQGIRYAVACLFELAANIGSYIETEQIATRQGIPLAYTHKILQSLTHAGLVFSLKGAGYRLARPLATISALEVIEALSSDSPAHVTSPKMGSVLEARINQVLETVTLGEL